MPYDIRSVQNINHLITYFSKVLKWDIDIDSFDDIDDISYDFSAADLGLKEEAFAKIRSLKQLPPMVDGQKWGIFCIEFDSKRFEVTALRKVLSGLVPSRRNSADHAVWSKEDLLFLCFWGEDNNRTIGVAHFEDKQDGLPQIKMTYCAPAIEDTVHIQDFILKIGNLTWPVEAYDFQKWHDDWSRAFTTAYKQVIHDSQTLTMQLAKEAIGIRDRILETLRIETETGYVHQLFKKFRETLIHDMSEKDFADMYAQTVVYGLFSARCMDTTQEDFSADEAVECIPNTNPFLKSLMKECLGNRENSKLSFDELEIGNVVDLLMHTNTDEIINDFNRQTGGGKEDPVIHFYEEFLTAYDKTQKVQRGVFYTPQPVVNFMVRATDSIIKKEFGLDEGLASTETKRIKYKRQSKYTVDGYNYKEVKDTKEVPAIQILDPATGTGTFIRQIILQIFENFKLSNADLSYDELHAAWNKYVPEHLLPRLNAFELMMAPYAVAHMKLAIVLKDTGYSFDSKERLQVYLTNSLEEPGGADKQISFFDDPLASESVAANSAKKNECINVVIGNPPYSVESSNKNAWIEELMQTYKKETDGVTKLQERNSKPINDDYVKFIRFAQYLVERSSKGIVAFINPHGYLDGPVFRGMRASLLRAFDKIYILDLHGNANRKETTPNGEKDENVFDIQQGVCISIFVKSSNQSSNCKVYHADLYGNRKDKYAFLNTKSLEDIDFTEVSTREPFYQFVELDHDLGNEYKSGFSVNDLFRIGSIGIKTARDKFTLAFTQEELVNRLNSFRCLPDLEARNQFSLGDDVQEWSVTSAQNDINQNACSGSSIDESKIIEVSYRPFDSRYMLFTGKSCGIIARPRTDVTKHFVLGNNIGLATARTNKSKKCDHFLAVSKMIEMKCAESTTGSLIYPLYVYLQFGTDTEKEVNFNVETVNSISKALQLNYVPDESTGYKTDSFSELDLFGYIYAILYSDKYRKKYIDYINGDFPRIPYPTQTKHFWALSELGVKLIKLHSQIDSVEINENSHFIDEGRQVEKVVYSNNRIYINRSSYFDGVGATDWDFEIGGHAPLQYWYKERKGRELTQQEITHYLRMIALIHQTRSIMEQIDSIIVV